ncbi:hypothetical protein [Hymenobacter actinosclerus]|uniref:Uncharacterized protein n=1 Tax=Hymenobacter actinosclerus TaxID=82805 RepID=A0A1I0A9N4_9BACT|nr:hypothetical protein [Hymenobacter actinosclerus]SES90442.1 hypothetical protein SAMN04487998_0624 [Hymenobacter actinosclerus]
MKNLLLPLLLLAAAAPAATAQQLPRPGQKNPDWRLLKTEAPLGTADLDLDPSQPRPVPMPNAAPISSGSHDSNGHWILYNDPAHSLRYNLKALLSKGIAVVQHTQTGTVYTYQAKNLAAVREPE